MILGQLRIGARATTYAALKISTTTIWLHFYKVSQMNSLGPINCAGEVAQKFWLSFSFFSGNFVYYEKEYQPIKYLVTFCCMFRGITSLLLLDYGILDLCDPSGKNRVHP